MINTTLCYIEQEGKYLLLHRVKKKNDINKDKWIGIGGKFEEGESPEDCIRRETMEETGLTLEKIEEVLPVSYSAVGITNEKSCCVIGTASGDFAPSTSDEEEIEAAWYDKEQVKELLKGTGFAVRTQAYCWWWAKQE